MSFFKNIFSKAKEQRQLTSVHDLLVGDIIVLTDSFALPAALRKQELRVSAINCYEFEHNKQTEWVLSGHSEKNIYLSLDIDDSTELKFSLKIDHQEIETLFDLDVFSTVFDAPGQAFLEKKADNNITSGWSSDQYQQNVFAQVGFFHRKDQRSETLSAYEGSEAGEQFELYALADQDQAKGVELEVWQDGDTDVFLTLYRPLSDIIDMFPGS